MQRFNLVADRVYREHLLYYPMVAARCAAPEEFAEYRKTGKLPKGVNAQQGKMAGKGKKDGILEKLGRNLTQEARDGKLDPVIGRNKAKSKLTSLQTYSYKNADRLFGANQYNSVWNP